MRYQGSKLKMANVLKTVIEDVISPDDIYVEPFMGGCNSFAAISHPKKLASDNNRYIAALWTDIKNGTFQAPQSLTEEQYYDIKDSYLKDDGRYPDSLIGYVATACSYGSGWWNGYAHYNPKKKENHILEAYNGLQKQLKKFNNLQDSEFKCCDYNELEIPENAFIYCDPPYQDTKEYENSFDSDAFFNWCRRQVKEGKKLLLSEYRAPADFVCIWTKQMQDGMQKNNSTKVEKLFVHISQIRIFNKVKAKIAI